MLRHAGSGISLESIAQQTAANRAYLRVALRLLASCGWLIEEVSADRRSFSYRITPAGQAVFDRAPALYREAAAFLPTAMCLPQLFSEPDGRSVNALRDVCRRITQGWSIEQEMQGVPSDIVGQIRMHLDGVVVAPVMATLSRAGILDLLSTGPMRLPHVDKMLRCLFDVLVAQGWLAVTRTDVHLTPDGACAAAVAPAYGTPLSYLPILNELPRLLSDAPVSRRSRRRPARVAIDRAMNLWGGGAAVPPTCIDRIDDLIIELFNRPLPQQPVGICEMGCGSGALLEHMYRVVRDRTARGRVLREHPLALIGVDPDTSARHAASRALRNAGAQGYHMVAGDVSRPAQLARALERFEFSVHDLLHVRGFVDHCRSDIYISTGRAGVGDVLSTAAFAHQGTQVFAGEIQADLVRHLRQWKPYIERFGLLVLERHALPTAVAAANLEQTPAPAYEATHGYSDQFLVELGVFLDCARKAGLDRHPRFRAQFPPAESGTVSLSFFTVPNGSKA